ncbi:MAG TPA: LuxR C-terminal-related transcriptional regulator [Gaiellaceae bacterium]|nr:LuxR C-terminal-related transcriptional regulator [Gaiellaceae bacterium]
MASTAVLRPMELVTESKLRPPVVRPGVVPRARLKRWRTAASRSRIVLVSAPAGYGKSTLVAEWSALDSRAAGWVHLDRGDDDPVVLLANVAAALDQIGSSSDPLWEELARRRPRIDAVVLPRLAGVLEECSPFVLVLEDTHLVTAEASLGILGFLADHVPHGSQAMLVTRGEAGLPLGRLRASGELFEIGTELLALDAEETRAVAASGGLELTAESAEALRERTEGWAAAVVLAAMSLRGREDAAERAAALSGNQQDIADFLLEEVLNSQPEEQTAFLLGTSILERMTAPLCNAVLQVGNAADTLEALVRSNAFVIPLDDRREWYRYHHLFGDLLRAELERRHPELLRLYLVRAASWCEVYGSPDEAFAYAHACGDLRQAGRIALANRDSYTQRGQSETARLWFDRCTEEEIASDPQLSISAGWASAYQGDEARARRFIAAAERAPLDGASPDGATSLRSALACLRASVAPDGLSQMLRDGEFVCASERRAGTRWYFSGARSVGTAHVLLGRPEEAIGPLRELVANRQPEVAPWRIMALGYLAFAARELGNRRDAHRWAAEATLAVAEENLEETLFSATASTADALMQVERGDHTAAARRLEDVRRLRPLVRAARWLDADLALHCADVSLDIGDRPGAVEFAQLAGDALQGYPDAGVLPDRLRRIDERIRLGRDYELTAAELRLIHFLPTHLSLQEIADRLHLSRPTVKTHVASIYAKLGVQGRSEAVEIIEQLRLGSMDSAIDGPDSQHE